MNSASVIFPGAAVVAVGAVSVGVVAVVVGVVVVGAGGTVDMYAARPAIAATITTTTITIAAVLDAPIRESLTWSPSKKYYGEVVNKYSSFLIWFKKLMYYVLGLT